MKTNWISVEKELPNDEKYKYVIAYFVDGTQDYVAVSSWFDKDLETYKGQILFWHEPLDEPLVPAIVIINKELMCSKCKEVPERQNGVRNAHF